MIDQDMHEVVMLRLKQTYRAWKELAEACQDEVACLLVREQFLELKTQLKEFGRCQFGIGVTPTDLNVPPM